MKDNKWVKLFITTENQVLVTIAATAGGFKVTESTTIDGVVRWNIVLEAESYDKVQKLFDDYDRETAAKYVVRAKNAQSGAEEDVPQTNGPTPQDIYDGFNKKQLTGWTSCMKKKIVGHYGPEIESCTDGITHGNWEKILECMVTVLGITDPEVWIPEQIIIFGGWSIECIFGVEK